MRSENKKPKGNALLVHHLSKSYGSLQAVHDLSLEIDSGEFFALLGPNGAGKSTIIAMIAGLITPSEGSIRVFNYEVEREIARVRELVGVVLQELVNIGYFPLYKILQFYSGYHGIWNNREREKWLLCKLGLWEQRYSLVRQLSGGMKRRFMIACALLHSPKLLILDEPTAGVDIELRFQLWDFLREIHRTEQMTLLLTTHYLEEAQELCPRLAILNRGSCTYLGETRALIEREGHRQVQLFWKTKPSKLSSSYEIEELSDRSTIFTIPSTHTLSQLFQEAGIDFSQVEDLRIREGNLQDAFRKIIKQEKIAS